MNMIKTDLGKGACLRGRIIGNRVRIPGGPAAVRAESHSGPEKTGSKPLAFDMPGRRSVEAKMLKPEDLPLPGT